MALSNREMCARTYTRRRARYYALGLTCRGTPRKNAQTCLGAHLTESQIQTIREIRAVKGTEPRRLTAKRYQVSVGYVALIQDGNSWAWLR